MTKQVAWVVMGLALLAPGAWADGSFKVERLQEAAPDFSYRGHSGPTSRLHGLRGRRVILHFWASWCSSCLREIPELSRAAQGWAGAGMEFLPVSTDSSDHEGEAERFVARMETPIPFWRAVAPQEIRPYVGWGLPVTYFIDADGKLLGRITGARDWKTVSRTDLEGLFGKP